MPSRSQPQHLHPYDTSGRNLNKCFPPRVEPSLALLLSFSPPPLSFPPLLFSSFSFKAETNLYLFPSCFFLLHTAELILTFSLLRSHLLWRCLPLWSLFTQSAVYKNFFPSLVFLSHFSPSLGRLLRILPNSYL